MRGFSEPLLLLQCDIHPFTLRGKRVHLWHWAGSSGALGSRLVVAAALCVAGVALGDIDLHFALGDIDLHFA